MVAMAETMKEFLDFLKEYKIIGLAIAVIIGTAAKDLVDALVADIIMPIVGLFLPGEGWKNFVVSLGGAKFQIGHLINVTITFVIIAFLVFLFVKYALKKEKVEKV